MTKENEKNSTGRVKADKARIDRLLHVGGSAKHPHPLRRTGFIMSGDDDDRHGDPPVVEGLQHVEAVDPRHLQVQQQEPQWV